jgi:hypothetical protein
MGNDLSVSSIIDQLHALQPSERAEALDNLCEQVCHGVEFSMVANTSTIE